MYLPPVVPAEVRASAGSAAAVATVRSIDLTIGAVSFEPDDPAAVNVAETQAPHATLATAQALPAPVDLSLAGSLDPGAGPAVFGVPLDPARTTVLVGFSWADPAATVPGHLALLDGSGTTLLGLPLPTSPVLITVRLGSVNAVPGASLYVGVIADGARGGDPAGPSAYTLRVFEPSAGQAASGLILPPSRPAPALHLR
jgi:hypothetical protein